MYKVKQSGKFKKSLKKYHKSGKFDFSKLDFIINKLSQGKKLDLKYKNHKLQGNFKGLWECHIEPDLLLVYEIIDDELILILVNLGSHSEIF